jgi:hypothetical protein
MENLVAPGRPFKLRTSSVLKRSVEFAGKNMVDGKEETCWNSDQGSPQWILVEFPTKVSLSRVRLMFQGGFVGQDGLIQVGEDDTETLRDVASLEGGVIEDSNEMQTFDVAESGYTGHCVRILFPSSTDFYGRVTIYALELWGHTVLAA